MAIDLEYKPELQKAGEIIREVGREVLRPNYKKIDGVEKPDGSSSCREEFVASDRIETALKRVFVNYPITNEEMRDGKRVDGRSSFGRSWILDPLDSTYQFIHGFEERLPLFDWGPMSGARLNDDPSYAILLTLMEGYEPVLGMAYMPHTGHFIWGNESAGSFLDRYDPESGEYISRTPLETKKTTSLSVLASGRRGKQNIRRVMDQLSHSSRFLEKGWADEKDISYNTMSGTVKLIEVVKGTVNLAYISPENTMHVWDVASVIPIIKGAGGFITDARRKKLDLSGDFVLREGVMVSNRLYTQGRLYHAQDGVFFSIPNGDYGDPQGDLEDILDAELEFKGFKR